MSLFERGVVVVTGAASGIGRATALTFARDGCRKLVLGDISTTGLEETQGMIHQRYPGAVVVSTHLDVSDEKSVDEFYSLAASKFGRVDVGAHVAGIGQAATPIHLTSSEVFDKVYAVNQRGAFLCERAALRQFLKQERDAETGLRGSITVVTSSLAEGTCNGMAAYSATKAGARGLCRSDALDYGPMGVRVNTVCPGPTMTPLLRASQNDAFIQAAANITPLQRNAEPEDIANAIVWLSSKRASFITGVSLMVDGGMGLEVGPD